MNKKTAILILIVIFSISVFLGYHASKIRVKDDIKSYVPSNDPDKLAYDNVANKFGLNDIVLIGISFDNVYKHFREIKEITDSLKSLPDVNNVISPVNAPRINITQDGVSVGNLDSSYNFKNYNYRNLEKALQNDSMIKGKFISNNSKSVLFIVGLKDNVDGKEVTKELRRTLDKFTKNYHLLGTVTANTEIEKIVKNNLLKLIPIVIVLVMLVLFFSYRTFTGVFLPIVSVLLADIWTVGIMQMLKVPFNTTTSAVPIAIVGIGTAYSIHVISKYYEEAHKNGSLSPEFIVNDSLKHVRMAILLSALTTIAGFLSLLTANLTPVWQLGIFSSLGIAITLLMANFMVPAMLILVKPKPRKKLSEDGESPILKKITLKILNHKIAVMATILVILIVLTMFIPRINSDMQIENFLNPNTELVQSSTYLRNNFGGNDFVFVDFSAKNNSFKDFYFNRCIRNLSAYAKTFKVVSQTTNVGDVVAHLTKVFTGVAYIPGNESAVEQNYMFITGSKGIDKILSSKDNESIAQIMVNTKSMSQVKKLQNSLASFAKKYILSSYVIKDLNISNPILLEAYKDEVKQFLFSNGQNFNENIFNALIESKKMSVDDILKISSLKNIYLTFNDYLKENFESPISLSKFKLLFNGKLNNEDINDDYEYFKEDDAQNIRADYAYSLIKKLNTNLSDEKIRELSWYANDSQVAIKGKGRMLKVSITGVPVLTNKVNDMVFTSQKESMALAYVLVFLLFVIQMNSVVIGLLAMIPISLTIIMNFGIMGLTKISLNAATVTIASITVGTGIDYTIHYLARFKIEYGKDFNKIKSGVRTSSTSGMAIIINSLAVILGFSTFILSDIGMLRQFGILTTAAMIIAPILTLTILPILLSILPDKLLKKFSKNSKGGKE